MLCTIDFSAFFTDDHHSLSSAMSRADYLTKYLLGDSKKKKLKKKKKNEEDSTRSIVITDEPDPIISNVPEPEPEEGEDEFTPVNVEVKNNFKGFKRIDGVEIKPKEDSAPQTIYRDSSGLVVDIEARKKQLAELKQQQQVDKVAKQQLVNLGEAEKIEKEKLEKRLKSSKSFNISKEDDQYNTIMKAKRRFDDPLQNFQSEPQSVDVSNTGRPNYNKGISPANRFNIKAGYFWDGIDRSNGFEELLMRKRTEEQAKKFDSSVNQSYNDYDYDL